MKLNLQEKQKLLSLARGEISAKCKDEPHIFESPSSDALKENCGAFVTLYLESDLAGCIGFIQSENPLFETVIQASSAAAFKDPRFKAIGTDDLPLLNIEISVLSTIEEIRNPNEIEIGRDGIYMKGRDHQGLLLPQVALKHGWDTETFLNQTCLKAGVPQGSWKEIDLEIYRFSADIFSESDIDSSRSNSPNT